MPRKLPDELRLQHAQRRDRRRKLRPSLFVPKVAMATLEGDSFGVAMSIPSSSFLLVTPGPVRVTARGRKKGTEVTYLLLYNMPEGTYKSAGNGLYKFYGSEVDK